MNEVSQAERELRAELREDLMQHLDRDVHRAGYIVAFVALRMPLELLEELVDELDAVYPAPGSGVVELPDDGTARERHDDPEAGR